VNGNIYADVDIPVMKEPIRTRDLENLVPPVNVETNVLPRDQNIITTLVSSMTGKPKLST